MSDTTASRKSDAHGGARSLSQDFVRRVYAEMYSLKHNDNLDFDKALQILYAKYPLLKNISAIGAENFNMALWVIHEEEKEKTNSDTSGKKYNEEGGTNVGNP